MQRTAAVEIAPSESRDTAGNRLLDTDRLDAIRALTTSALCDTLLEQLCKDIERQAEAYPEITTADCLLETERTMHALTGQCLNVGAIALGELSLRLSQAAMAGDRATLEAAQSEFVAVCGETIERVQQELDLRSTTKTSPAFHAA